MFRVLTRTVPTRRSISRKSPPPSTLVQPFAAFISSRKHGRLMVLGRLVDGRRDAACELLWERTAGRRRPSWRRAGCSRGSRSRGGGGAATACASRFGRRRRESLLVDAVDGTRYVFVVLSSIAGDFCSSGVSRGPAWPSCSVRSVLSSRLAVHRASCSPLLAPSALYGAQVAPVPFSLTLFMRTLLTSYPPRLEQRDFTRRESEVASS